jgi:hypothetical protein
MLKTIRSEQVGKLTLRLVQTDDGYVGAIIGGTAVPNIEGDDSDQVWAKLRAEVGKASPHYFGFDGARARFFRMFPNGFVGEPFAAQERNYKVAASDYLKGALPLEAARTASAGDWEAAARAFGKTNMLSTFEHARTREVLKSADGAAFIQAAAAIADGDFGPALQDIERIFKPFGPASWPAATYLPFLWRPATHMFLKPEVTKDFAERVGHRFAQDYEPRLRENVYVQLLSLSAQTALDLQDLGALDQIDIQSFIWVVGAYKDSGMTKSGKV